MADSWRFNFITDDESFDVPVPDTNKKGFMVVRAPKGTTAGLYVPKNSPNVIKSMLGDTSADWKDIQELVDYNQQFGCWVSAPPGSSAAYPSLFGGSYLTSRGIFAFRTEPDKTNLSYEVNAGIGTEQAGLSVAANTVLAAGLAGIDLNVSANEIVISGIGADLAKLLIGIDFIYWPNGNKYVLSLVGTQLMGAPNATAIPQVVGSLVNGVLTITGTAGNGSWLNLDFNSLVATAPFTDVNLVLDENAYKIALTVALLTKLQWIVDVTKDTYLTIVQKSPTEIPTTVTVSAIGYDKWVYDYRLPAYVDLPTASVLTTLMIGGDTFVAFNPTGNPLYFATGVYKLVGAAIANVTSSFRTRYIKITSAGSTSAGPDAGVTAAYLNNIFLVGMDLTVTKPATPKVNPAYNAITFNVKEVTTNGTALNGGTFTGSLAIKGVDSYGQNIAFKNILPDNAVSFVEVIVSRTFDADLDANGWYTKTKIIDTFTNPAPVVYNIVGKRYVTSVASDLISQGILGSANDQRYTAALLDGWNEFAAPAYDVVAVAMEVTGVEDLKPALYALRFATRKLTTFISPRLISQAEFNDPASIIVSGRTTDGGASQLVNEFKRTDTSSGVTYWSSMIGFYGANLTAIIQDKMGAVAPMYAGANGYGGLIPADVIEEKWHFDNTAQKTLNALGLIPVILDPVLGVVAVGQKTTRDPSNVSDWSFLGHSMAFDVVRREIRDGVMTPQLGLPNDPYYQGVRQTGTTSILNRRTSGTRPVWANAESIIGAVNTPDVMAQRDFRIKVRVKVYIFSETVTLDFTNEGQTTTF